MDPVRTIEEALAIDADAWSNHVGAFRSRIRVARREAEADGHASTAEHYRLFEEVVRLDPRDWDGYGLLDRWEEAHGGSTGDCSCGCRWFRPLQGSLCTDWGTCTNPASYRCGLLTFEHQGCYAFEQGDWEDEAGPDA